MIQPAVEIHTADCVTTISGWVAGSPEAGGLFDCQPGAQRARREQPSLIFADPPYNEDVRYPGTCGDRMGHDDYAAWSGMWIGWCAKWLRDGGAMWVLISEDWADVIASHLRGAGLQRRRWIIWHETFGQYRPDNFGKCARHLFYCVKPGRPFVFDGTRVKEPSARSRRRDKRAPPDGMKIMENVWQIPRVCGTHDAKVKWRNQVPVELIRRAVQSTSVPGGLVLDPFCGSGSTAEVCVEHCRSFVGIDASPEASEVARARLDRARERLRRCSIAWRKAYDGDYGYLAGHI